MLKLFQNDYAYFFPTVNTTADEMLERLSMPGTAP